MSTRSGESELFSCRMLHEYSTWHSVCRMAYSIPHRVSEEIWLEMRRQGITITTLSAALGIARQTLGRKLRGAAVIDVAELEVIAATLGIPAAELVRRAEVAA